MGNKKVVKRGRPPKTKRLVEEELNASLSSPETDSTSLDEPMASKPRRRYASAVSDKKATPGSQSRIMVQNMDEHSSETLMLVKQTLFEPKKVDQANHVRVEAKDTHSDLESLGRVIEAQKGMISPYKIMNQTPPRKNELDIGKFTYDLLAQTPQPELPLHVSSLSEKTLTKCNPPETEANAAPNLTVQTRPEDLVIELEGYKVKKEVAPLLKAIFKKYGDIAKNSIFSEESRSCLLEMVCSIYKRLEASDLMQLTPLELDSIKGQIKDLELVKVNIGWLQKRFNLISMAMDMDFKGCGAIDVLINEKKRAVKKCEEELQKLEDELCALQMCNGSLVHGLI